MTDKKQLVILSIGGIIVIAGVAYYLSKIQTVSSGSGTSGGGSGSGGSGSTSQYLNAEFQASSANAAGLTTIVLFAGTPGAYAGNDEWANSYKTIGSVSLAPGFSASQKIGPIPTNGVVYVATSRPPGQGFNGTITIGGVVYQVSDVSYEGFDLQLVGPPVGMLVA